MTRFFMFITCMLAWIPTLLAQQSATEIAPSASDIKIGVQLHSVKQHINDDFVGTLKALADIGFEGVEFAGRYGEYKDDPVGLKRLLAELGLDVIGVHAGIPSLRGEQGKKNFSFYAALGATNVIIPHDARVNDVKQIDALIEELNQLEKVALSFGLRLGYHNHAKEFQPYKSTTFWQYLAANTSPQFIMQLDVGWAIYAGQDPLELIKNVHPNRVVTSHFKIRSYQGKPSTVAADAQVIIGDDNYDWDQLVKTTHNYGGTKWLIVEQEEYPLGKTPLDAVAASYRGLLNVSPYLNQVTNKRKISNRANNE